MASRAEATWSRLDASMTAQQRTAVHAVLDQAAGESATSEGLRRAATTVDKGQGAGEDRAWAGSGTAPWQQLLHDGSMAILASIVTRGCKQGSSVEMTRAVEEIPIVFVFHSGGKNTAEQEADRRELREAARGCLPSR